MARHAAPLHDIGKIGITDLILKKPGKLNDDEWDVMRTHATIGEEVLRTTIDLSETQGSYMNELIEIAIEIAGGHHEKWDGSGYPRKLIGEEIPLSARIMAVADVHDALTSPRVYKHAWTHAEAVAEIKRLSGSKFDPKIVEAFLSLEDDFQFIAEKYRDNDY